jgi:hypothetical protein
MKEKNFAVLLHGACARVRPPGCHPAMPSADPSQYVNFKEMSYLYFDY